MAIHSGVDYDSIASSYDRRYEHNDYSGVADALVGFVGAAAGLSVLEVGCGTGHWLRLLRARGVRVAGLDASTRMLARAQAQGAGTPLVRGVAEHLPWTDESFNRLFCVNALQHFGDKRRFFSEARRVLQPAGRLMTIALDPHTGLDRWYIYEYFTPALETDRHRYLAAGETRELMRQAGFVECVTREVQHRPVQFSARAALEQGRLDKSATSQLAVLTDEQYQQGIDRIRDAIEAAEASGRILFLSADLRLYGTFGSVPS